MIDADKITVTADGFHPRLALSAGGLVVARTLTAEDMDYLMKAFMQHGQACAAITASFDAGDLDVPRWKRRLQERAAVKQNRQKR